VTAPGSASHRDGPLCHVVCLTWKPDTDPEAVEALCAALAALPEAIPELSDYRFGPDLGLVEGNADFTIVGNFPDAAAWARYQEHPEHQRVLAELIRPHLASRTAVQVRITDGARG
jgi:hypothetical protein